MTSTAVRPGSATPALTVAIQTDKSHAAYREIARLVHRLGFDGLSAFGDLGFGPPVPALMAAAPECPGLRLGVACLSPRLTHPVEIAGQAAALHDAAGGHSYLGLARGAWMGQIGIHHRAALDRMAETIEVVQRLWRGDDRGFAGRYFSLEPGFTLRFPLPAELPDLLIGTWGPRGAALAARHATEVKLGGCANPDMVRVMGGWLADESARLDAQRPGVVAGAVTVVDRDRRAARQRARTEVAMYLDVVAGLDRTVRLPDDLMTRLRARLTDGDHRGAGALIPDELLDRFAMAGTPEDVVAHSLSLIRAGATRVEFGTPHGLDPQTGLELLGAEVLPAVRSALPSTMAGALT